MRVNGRMKKLLSIVLTLCVVLSCTPAPAYAVGTDNLCEHHPEHTPECHYAEAEEGGGCTFVCEACKAEEKSCTCESTDPGEHAPFCDLYVRTYKECKCVLNCAVEGLNDYCETCYFEGVEACTGGDEEQIVYATSGTTGDCTWTLDDSGKLTISGSGAIPANAFGNNEEISVVIIGDGVTGIGTSAFRGCSNLTSVTIQGSVKTIGNYAFNGCSNLTSVTIQGSVETIGNYAFYGCSSLTAVYYYGLTAPTAAHTTFANSSNPTIWVAEDYEGEKFGGMDVEKKLPPVNSVTTYTVSFANNGGSGTMESATGISVEYTLPECAFTAPEGKTFAAWRVGEAEYQPGDKITVSADTQVIAVWAELHVHNWDSFRGVCSGCDETHGDHDHTWTSGVCSVCGVVGGYCGYTGAETLVEYVLTSENNGSTYTITISGTGRMGEYNTASYDTTNQPWKDYRNKITAAVVMSGVQDVGWGAFQNHTALTSVSIPDSITTIGSMAFSGTTSLYSVTLPSALTSLGSNAFYNSGIQSITIPAGVTRIQYNTFQKSKLSSINLGNVTTIDTSAFRDCKQLTSITLPGTLVTIGTDAFNGSNLTSVTIPSSVTKIGERAFQGCNALKTVSISGGDLNVMQQAFWSDDALETLTITNTGTVTLGKRAFALQSGEQDKLNSITLPQNVIFTDSYADVFEYRRTPVTGVSLDKTEMTVYIGNSEKLTATVEPGTATNKKVTWSSSDNNIATVDSNGNVTGVSAGAATITVTTVDGGKTAACTVTVPAHTHNWTYTAEGATITATCTSANCPNNDGGSVTISASNAIYDGAAKAASLSADSVGDIQNLRITYENLSSAPVNAGTYTAKLTVDTDKTISVTYTIARKELTVKADDQTIPYGGTPDSTKITNTGLIDGHSVTVTLTPSTTDATDNGTVTPSAAVIKDGNNNDVTANYNVTYGNGKLTITKAEAPVINFPQVMNGITYGQKLSEAKLAFYTNELGSFNWTAPIGVPDGVGTKHYALDFYPNEPALQNYDWASCDWTSHGATWVADRNALCAMGEVTVIKAESGIMTHPVAKKWSYRGDDQHLTLIEPGTAEGGVLVYSLAENGTYSETLPYGTDAGEYTVWYYVQGDDNHNDSEKQSIKVTIDKANPLFIDFRVSLPENAVYNGQVKEIAVEKLHPQMGAVTVNYYKNGVLLDGAPVDAGTYTFTLNVAESDNFAAASGLTDTMRPESCQFTIEQASLVITANEVSKIYGETDPILTYKVEGLVNGNALTGELKRAAGEDVGSYDIGQNTLTAGNNYTITYTGADLTINAKAITKADVKLNGSLTYNGKEQTQAVTVTDGITYEVSGNKATNAGKYELTVKGTGNYAGTITVNWEIAKAAVTITAENKVIYIGEEIPTLTYQVSGLADGDQLTKNPTLTADGDEDQAGSYTITAANADAGDNYTITYVSGKLTIMDKETEVETRILLTELTEVPDGLKNTQLNTVDKIKEELVSKILATATGYSAENMVHYDVTLQFSLDGGDSWIRAAEDTFPTEGITVILPYSEGTNARDYDFAVSHMFSVTSQRLGINAGDVELPKVEETANGIRVVLNGLSPVTVAAKYHDHIGGTATCTDRAICTVCGNTYGEPDAANHAGGTELKNAKDATCGAEGYTGDAYCKECGELVTKGTAIKVTGTHTYGEWKVVTEATKTAKGEKQRTCSVCGHVDSEEIPMRSDVPATGDDSNILLWGGVMAVSLAALTALLVESKKRKAVK